MKNNTCLICGNKLVKGMNGREVYMIDKELIGGKNVWEKL